MDFRRRIFIALVALVAASAGGCRQHAAQRELLERDLRLQEDRIYQLEAELEEAKRALGRSGVRDEACAPPVGTFSFGVPSGDAPPFRTMPAELAPTVVMPGASSGAPSSIPAAPRTTSPPLPDQFDVSPPVVELPPATSPPIVSPPPAGTTPAGSAPPFRGGPIVSPPDAAMPEGLPSRAPAGAPTSIPAAPAAPAAAPTTAPSSAPPFKPAQAAPMKQMSSPKFMSPAAKMSLRSSPPPQFESPPQAQPAGPLSVDAATSNEAAPADAPVERITLHRATGGLDFDGKPGHDGLAVVVEPRDAGGRLVPQAGAVTIAVIDPAISGEGGRYARLDFTAEDAALMIRPASTGGSGGLHFEIPWPDAPPAHDRVHVFVRFTTDDGRRLEADREVVLQLDPSAVRAPTAAFELDRHFIGPGAEMVGPPPVPNVGEVFTADAATGPILVGPAIVPATGDGQSPQEPVFAPAAAPRSARVPTTAGAPDGWKRRK